MRGGYSSAQLTVAPPAPGGAGGSKAAQQAGGAAAGRVLQLDLGSSGRCLLYVPKAYRPGAPPLPLALTLHGAGGDAADGMRHLLPHADAAGALLLSPKSRGSTWDMLRGGYGPGECI